MLTTPSVPVTTEVPFTTDNGGNKFHRPHQTGHNLKRCFAVFEKCEAVGNLTCCPHFIQGDLVQESGQELEIDASILNQNDCIMECKVSCSVLSGEDQKCDKCNKSVEIWG